MNFTRNKDHEIKTIILWPHREGRSNYGKYFNTGEGRKKGKRQIDGMLQKCTWHNVVRDYRTYAAVIHQVTRNQPIGRNYSSYTKKEEQ